MLLISLLGRGSPSIKRSECEEEVRSRVLSSPMLDKKTLKKNRIELDFRIEEHIKGRNTRELIIVDYIRAYRICCKNIAIREALKHTIFPSCCDTPVHEDSYFDEQKFRLKRHSLETSSRAA